MCFQDSPFRKLHLGSVEMYRKQLLHKITIRRELVSVKIEKELSFFKEILNPRLFQIFNIILHFTLTSFRI